MIQILFTKGFEKTNEKYVLREILKKQTKKYIARKKRTKNILLGLFVKDFTR